MTQDFTKNNKPKGFTARKQIIERLESFVRAISSDDKKTVADLDVAFSFVRQATILTMSKVLTKETPASSLTDLQEKVVAATHDTIVMELEPRLWDRGVKKEVLAAKTSNNQGVQVQFPKTPSHQVVAATVELLMSQKI